MTNLSFPQQLLMGLLVLCGALSSCQKASYSYSFQQPESVLEKQGVVPSSCFSDSASTPIALPLVEVPNGRQAHLPVVRKPSMRSVVRGRVAAGRPQLQPVRLVAASLRKALPKRPVLTDGPTPAPYPSKAVAVMLAVVFGIFGAHLFYLGYRRKAFGYLAATLLCVLLMVLLLATLPAASLSTGLTALFLASMAAVCIAIVYAYALLDALRILLNGPESIG